MTESMKKSCQDLLDRINAIQWRASGDHSDGAGMIRGAFGEYLVLSQVQDLLKAILIMNPNDATGQVVEDIVAHQKELKKTMADLTQIHNAAVDTLIKINVLRNKLEAFNDDKNA